MTSASKLLANKGALCNMARRIAVEAGEIILAYFEDIETLSFDTKQDGSPVTEADRAAEKHIEKGLLSLLPDVPIIAEEASDSAGGAHLDHVPEYFWLVDPLDGTREFIAGGPNFTVNIALMHQAQPVLGVIYAPVHETLYAAHGAGTAIRWSAESDRDKPVFARAPGPQGLTVITNSKPGQSQKLEKFLESYKVQKILRRASSLKLCAIAEGRADLYPRFGETYEWDTAAGDAILRAAGGQITDMNGQTLTYGKTETAFRNGPFVASSFDWNFSG